MFKAKVSASLVLSVVCGRRTAAGLSRVYRWSSSCSRRLLPTAHRLQSVSCTLSCVWLSATPWTVAHQAPLSVGVSRQECWSGLPFPPPRALPNPGNEPWSAYIGGRISSEPPGKPPRTELISAKQCAGFEGKGGYLSQLLYLFCLKGSAHFIGKSLLILFSVLYNPLF